MPGPQSAPRRTIERAVVLGRRAGRALPAPLRTPLARALARTPAPIGPALQPAPAKTTGRLTSDLRAIVALGEDRLELTGWAFRSEAEVNPESISLVAVGPAGTEPVVVRAELTADEEVNRAEVDRALDRAGASFRAVLDVGDLVGAGPGRDHGWRLEIRIRDAAGQRQEPFARVARFGSAAAVPPWYAGSGQGPLVVVQPVDRIGLSVRLQWPDVRAGRVRATPEAIVLGLSCSRWFLPRRAALVQWPEKRDGERAERPQRLTLPLSRLGRRVRIDLARLTRMTAADGRWGIEVHDAFGHLRVVRWAPAAESWSPAAGPAWALTASASGLLRLDWGTEAARVVDAGLVPGDPARLRVRLTGLTADQQDRLTADRCRLEGERQHVRAESTTRDASGVVVVFALLGSNRFATELLPLASGRYRVLLEASVFSAVDSSAPAPDGQRAGQRDAQAGPVPVGVSPELAAGLGRRVELAQFGARIERSGRGEFAVRISVPRGVEDGGRFRMLQLAEYYRSDPAVLAEPLAESVLFDCFDGRSTGDNVRPIRDELLRRRSGLAEYWVVADLSVPVPAGATPVVWFSRDHFAARARSRLVVTNCWLRGDFRRRDGQRVLQTWHGTPFKRLGTDRIGTDQSAAYRADLADQTGQWTWLISQNPYSTEIFARTYAYDGTIVELGYPRNDVLSRRLDEQQRERVRTRIGLGPGERAVLFAPTWREDGTHATRRLDFSRLTARLGPAVTILVRGHANTLRSGSDVEGPAVIDVTSYPELTDLFAVADVLVTDYSSMMFDFAITGKPMIFFVPDLDDYAERSRGTYFDLRESAPGPLVSSTDAVADEIDRAGDGVPAEFAERYRAWTDRFTPFDDGHAAERAVDLLLSDLA